MKPMPGAVKSMRSIKATLVFTVVLSALLKMVACARLIPSNWGSQDDRVMVAAFADAASMPLKSAKAAKLYRDAVRM
jgi:hypothetical protein